MKVALCYHGIAKGYNFKNGGLPVGYEHEFDLVNKNLIEYNKEHSFDIYLHSWSLEYEKEIVAKMSPKKYLFEPSKEFKKPSIFKLVKEKVKKSLGKGYEVQRMNNIYSRWYSYKKVCDLVEQSNEKYDLVIVTRFDMCLFRQFNISELDSSNFYSGDWITYYKDGVELLEEKYDSKDASLERVSKGYPFDNEGFQDFFFISSQEYMINKFSTIFNNLSALIKKYGPSNHSIAFGKLKEDNKLNKHKRVLTYGSDYFLSRWI